LTGYMQEGTDSPDTDDLYGRIENSTLILTWPDSKHELKMIRDDSNNLMLDGLWRHYTGISGKINMKKIE